MDGRSCRVHSNWYGCSICGVTPPTVPVRSSTGQLFCLLCVQGSVCPQGQAWQPSLAPIPQRPKSPLLVIPGRIINQPRRGCMSLINPVNDEPFTAQVTREVLDRLHSLGVLSAALEVAFDDERKHFDWGFVTQLELLLRAIWSE